MFSVATYDFLLLMENLTFRSVHTYGYSLIEAGAFANALGIENVFLLVAPNKDYKLPSDFLSLNYIKFDYARGADNDDAYRRICEKINQVLRTNAERIEQSSESLIKNENPITIRKGKGKLI